MRRVLVVVCLVLAGVPAGTRADDQMPVPLVPRACTPAPAPFDIVRAAGCQRILYTYGPLHVTAGDNLILIGPVTIEKPAVDGYVVRFVPNMYRIVDTKDGQVLEIPPIEELHLHHAVWLSSAFSHPLFASGEEKTIFNIPNGYGIRVKTSDVWLLNYMLHNQTPKPENVLITYEIDFIPASAVASGSITPVEPYWINVAGFNGANPVYNTQLGKGTNGECAFPKERCSDFDPYGSKEPTHLGGYGVPGEEDDPPDGTVVWIVGHVHPGGLRTVVEMKRNGVTKHVFTSDAVYYDPNGPLSWDMSLETSTPGYRLRIKPGDRLIVNSVYETQRASWYEGMGIAVMFIAAVDTPGADPFDDTDFKPDAAAVTHGHMSEADGHGGPDDPDHAPAFAPVDTSTVAIGGFAYLAGGAAGRAARVKQGDPLTFVNVDAAAQVFHTVTACAYPCNGATGISYPLANGPVDFDSLELGFGVPKATAASNHATYRLDTTGFVSGVYTFFCRVHPSMRGAFVVQ